MALADIDIPAVLARGDLTAREKTRAIYALKVDSIANWLINGKPAPQPLPPVVGSTFTLNGVDYKVVRVAVEQIPDGDGVPIKVLRIEGSAVKGAQRQSFQFRIVNPPVLTRDLREHYIDAASEIIEGAVKWP